jgi:hypothetical protein
MWHKESFWWLGQCIHRIRELKASRRKPMSVNIREAVFITGRMPTRSFGPDCVSDDWEDFGVVVEVGDNQPFKSKGGVRVIATANDDGIGRRSHGAAAVCVVTYKEWKDAAGHDRQGFRVSARNSDCASGKAGINWMAVQETEGTEQGGPVGLRMGMVNPKHFWRDCDVGDWNGWDVDYHWELEGDHVELLTANDVNITPFYRGYWPHTGLRYHNAAVVGIVRESTSKGFRLAARSSDSHEGDCGFNYVALSEDSPGRGDI